MSLDHGCLLGIETSCDETAAAVLRLDGHLLSSEVVSQHHIHNQFGGVVPELASRQHIQHIERVVQVVMKEAQVSWKDLRAVAVTRGPGLAGSLTVGVNFGKGLAYAAGIPWIAVHHLEGHIASAWLEQPEFPIPAVALVVSGGHTHLYYLPQRAQYRLIGRTLDDAAGEAFDKGAKMLGLGYPGGPALDCLAQKGDCHAVRFPRPYLQRGGLNFSFSGIKTALLYYLRKAQMSGQSIALADVAASYQEAIVEVLVEKAFRAVRHYRVKGLAVVGGVAANSRLRALLTARASQAGVQLTIPRPRFCTDNAAMVALAGLEAYRAGVYATWEMDAMADLPAAHREECLVPVR
ncbi:MAG: tRNA (adenosine(37)-N6)-threonylcarbamoyltransferase complex transferase subunit TsaD [Nitrospirae bacterium]|nr:MAG: tRNA (adenosine(37)-N6)-threonylcarbamoyltransferase complex transferase subunit TsaD [Nitrospirota bacterium]